jgi:multiple sugar transport system substrate-binding protein
MTTPSGRDPVEEAMVDEFNASQSDIEIERVIVPSDLSGNLATAMRSGQGPDIFIGEPAETAIASGFAIPLNDLVSEETQSIFADYITGNQARVVNGQFYNLPRTFTTARLLYNRDLFRLAGLDPEAPPTTFSEVRAAALAITEAGGNDVFGYGLDLAWGGVFEWEIEPLILAGNPDLTGVGLFNQSSQQFEMQHFAPAIELFRGMIADGSMYPGVSSLDRDLTRAAFADGTLGMYFGNFNEFGVQNVQLETDADWGAALPPVPDGASLARAVGLAGQEVYISSQAEDPEAAAVVLEFYVSQEMIQRLAEEGQVNPLRPDVQVDVPELVDMPGYSGFALSEIDEQWPLRPASFLEIRGETYQDIVTRAILSTDDYEDALASISQVYTDAYNAAVDAGDIDPTRFAP